MDDTFREPLMCEGCRQGQHWLCGLQVWCECECDGSSEWGDEPEFLRDYPHADTCTCDTCVMTYPGRVFLIEEETIDGD